jgi:copper chaperone
VYYIDRLYVRRVVLSSWTFSIVLAQLILSSSYFLLIFSLATESGALLYDISEGFGGKEHKIMEAYGRIANNQLQIDGLISWIQSGLWYLTVSYNDTDRSKNAYFYTDFKMVRPDGSSLHEHSIKNFKSTNVLIEKGKIIGCSTCKPIVERQLRDEEAVKKIDIDYITNSVIVEFDPSMITKEEIKNRLEKSGYKFVRTSR